MTPTTDAQPDPNEPNYDETLHAGWVEIHEIRIDKIYPVGIPRVSPMFVEHAVALAAMMSHAPENTIKPKGRMPTKTRYSQRNGRVSNNHGRAGMGNLFAFLRGDKFKARGGRSRQEKIAIKKRGERHAAAIKAKYASQTND